MKYKVEVEIPTDTQDECDDCQFLLGGNYCVLFQDTVVNHSGHIYKLKECPASREKRYDDR